MVVFSVIWFLGTVHVICDQEKAVASGEWPFVPQDKRVTRQMTRRAAHACGPITPIGPNKGIRVKAGTIHKARTVGRRASQPAGGKRPRQ